MISSGQRLKDAEAGATLETPDLFPGASTLLSAASAINHGALQRRIQRRRQAGAPEATQAGGAVVQAQKMPPADASHPTPEKVPAAVHPAHPAEDVPAR